MTEVYMHEFLFRGRQGSEPPAWHVILTSVGEDGFGQPTRAERTLNMAQAIEAGFPLPKIIKAINADLAVEIEAARATIAERDETIRGMAQALTDAEKRATAHPDG